MLSSRLQHLCFLASLEFLADADPALPEQTFLTMFMARTFLSGDSPAQTLSTLLPQFTHTEVVFKAQLGGATSLQHSTHVLLPPSAPLQSGPPVTTIALGLCPCSCPGFTSDFATLRQL